MHKQTWAASRWPWKEVLKSSVSPGQTYRYSNMAAHPQDEKPSLASISDDENARQKRVEQEHLDATRSHLARLCTAHALVDQVWPSRCRWNALRTLLWIKFGRTDAAGRVGRAAFSTWFIDRTLRKHTWAAPVSHDKQHTSRQDGSVGARSTPSFSRHRALPRLALRRLPAPASMLQSSASLCADDRHSASRRFLAPGEHPCMMDCQLTQAQC
ncbi:unnamed protein product [Aphanomyces euteiches]